MFATIQTVAGCPENCSFCSVWVTDGCQPRQRLTDKIIEEANELYDRSNQILFKRFGPEGVYPGNGSVLAQFPIYHPYPGTKDFHEMIGDNKDRAAPNFVPKHEVRLREERFWLKPINEVDVINHANISRDDLLTENKKWWDLFYSIKEAVARVRRGRPGKWRLAGKFVYVLFCIAFKRIYGGQGMAADGVRRRRLGHHENRYRHLQPALAETIREHGRGPWAQPADRI